MKKPAAKFAVEYKNSRRRALRPASSIWGSLDLKTVAKEIEDEALPRPDQDVVTRPAQNVAPPTNEVSEPSLTALSSQTTTRSVAQEKPMVKESDVDTKFDTEGAGVMPTRGDTPKKRRGARTQASVGASQGEAAISGSANAVKKRGRPRAAAKVNDDGSAGQAKGTAAARPLPAPGITVHDIAAPFDEVEDLHQLELENQHLRKLLAEKLRKENAYLRNRLELHWHVS